MNRQWRARERSQMEDKAPLALEDLQTEKRDSNWENIELEDFEYSRRRMISIHETCDERTGDEVFENTRLLPSEHIYLWNSLVREKKKSSISRVPATLSRSSSNSSSGIESDSDSTGLGEMEGMSIAQRIQKLGGAPAVGRKVPKTARTNLDRNSSGFSEIQKSSSLKKMPPPPPPQSSKPKSQPSTSYQSHPVYTPSEPSSRPKAPAKPKRTKSNRNSTIQQESPESPESLESSSALETRKMNMQVKLEDVVYAELMRNDGDEENVYDTVYNEDNRSQTRNPNSSLNRSIRPSFPPPPPYEAIVKMNNSSLNSYPHELIHTSIDIPEKRERSKSSCLPLIPPQTKLWWRNFKMIAILIVTLICVIVILVLTFTTNKV